MTPPVIPAEPSPEELKQLLLDLNSARKAGYSVKDLDAFAQQDVGMSYKELGKVVGAMREEPAVPMTTKKLLQQQLYGLTLGWLDELEGVFAATRDIKHGVLDIAGYKRVSKQAREEVEKFARDHPKTAYAMRAAGAVPAMGGILASAPLATGALGALGPPAAVGATAAGGGLLGEPSGPVDRTQSAAGGALAGGLAGGAGLVGAGMLAGRSAKAAGAVSAAKNAPWWMKGGALLGGYEAYKRLKSSPIPFIGE